MSIVPFDFNGFELRTLGTWDAPLFVAADVCKILEIKNVSMACECLDEDEKGIYSVKTHGGGQDALCVTEPGLYRLVFKSRKPIAKVFQKWVFSKLLPSIRTQSLSGDWVIKKLNEIQESQSELIEIASASMESVYRDRLADLLAGATEVQSYISAFATLEESDVAVAVFADVVTDVAVIEVKSFALWKQALGQALVYKKCIKFSEKEPGVYLFNCPKDNRLRDVFSIFDEYEIEFCYYTFTGESEIRRML